MLSADTEKALKAWVGPDAEIKSSLNKAFEYVAGCVVCPVVTPSVSNVTQDRLRRLCNAESVPWPVKSPKLQNQIITHLKGQMSRFSERDFASTDEYERRLSFDNESCGLQLRKMHDEAKEEWSWDLQVTIMDASHVLHTAPNAKAVVKLRLSSQDKKCRSKPAQNAASPAWNETFTLPKVSLDQKIMITMRGKSYFYGRAEIDLRDADPLDTAVHSVTLVEQNQERAELRLELAFNLLSGDQPQNRLSAAEAERCYLALYRSLVASRGPTDTHPLGSLHVLDAALLQEFALRFGPPLVKTFLFHVAEAMALSNTVTVPFVAMSAPLVTFRNLVLKNRIPLSRSERELLLQAEADLVSQVRRIISRFWENADNLVPAVSVCLSISLITARYNPKIASNMFVEGCVESAIEFDLAAALSKACDVWVAETCSKHGLVLPKGRQAGRGFSSATVGQLLGNLMNSARTLEAVLAKAEEEVDPPPWALSSVFVDCCWAWVDSIVETFLEMPLEEEEGSASAAGLYSLFFEWQDFVKDKGTSKSLATEIVPRVFLPHLQRWLLVAQTSMIPRVTEAVNQDLFYCISRDSPVSSSAVDVLRMCFDVRAMIAGMPFVGTGQKLLPELAHSFVELFCAILTAYARILKEAILRAIHTRREDLCSVICTDSFDITPAQVTMVVDLEFMQTSLEEAISESMPPFFQTCGAEFDESDSEAALVSCAQELRRQTQQLIEKLAAKSYVVWMRLPLQDVFASANIDDKFDDYLQDLHLYMHKNTAIMPESVVRKYCREMFEMLVQTIAQIFMPSGLPLAEKSKSKKDKDKGDSEHDEDYRSIININSHQLEFLKALCESQLLLEFFSAEGRIIDENYVTRRLKLAMEQLSLLATDSVSLLGRVSSMLSSSDAFAARQSFDLISLAEGRLLNEPDEKVKRWFKQHESVVKDLPARHFDEYFGLPPKTTRILTDAKGRSLPLFEMFACFSTALIKGYLYLSGSHLCFDTLLFSARRNQVVIALSNIQEIKKVAGYYGPTALEICFVEELKESTIYFSGFANRDKVASYIQQRCQNGGHEVPVVLVGAQPLDFALSVNVAHVSGLRPPANGKSLSTYVCVVVRGKTKYTKVVKNSENPTFDKNFVFSLDSDSKDIVVEVYDHRTVGDRFIGGNESELVGLFFGKQWTLELPLNNANASGTAESVPGTIHLTLECVPQKKKSKLKVLSKGVSGVLTLSSTPKTSSKDKKEKTPTVKPKANAPRLTPKSRANSKPAAQKEISATPEVLPQRPRANSDASADGSASKQQARPRAMSTGSIANEATARPISRGSAKWMPDREASSCTKCSAVFTFFRRRHHCRRCGKIFCGTCSSYREAISGITSRVCVTCHLKFAKQRKTKTRRR